MKNLDLSNYGVLEMNQQEKVDFNGGFNDRPLGRGDYGSQGTGGSSSSGSSNTSTKSSTEDLAWFIFWFSILTS